MRHRAIDEIKMQMIVRSAQIEGEIGRLEWEQRELKRQMEPLLMREAVSLFEQSNSDVP